MIGVFDSGHGGLTVLRAMVDRLAGRSFLYYGDHAHIPYGDRASEEIRAETRLGGASRFASIYFGREARFETILGPAS
jgi:glutamate racemase